MSSITLIRGLPGSGKTMLGKTMVMNYPDAVLYLNPDEVDVNSADFCAFLESDSHRPASIRTKLYRYNLQLAMSATRTGVDVIWDQPWSRVDGLVYTIDEIKSVAPESAVSLIEVHIEPEEATRRVRERIANGGHGPSEETMDRFIQEFGEIDINCIPGIEKVIRVSGEAEPDPHHIISRIRDTHGEKDFPRPAFSDRE